MGLKAISIATPNWRVDNQTISEWCGLPVSMISDRIGVTSRAFLSHNESGIDLAAQACEQLRHEQPDLDFAAVKLIVFVTQNPDFKLPHSGALLQQRLGFGTDTASFDVNLGCSGYVYALSIASSLMQTEQIENALVVTCDPYSKIMARDSRDVIGLFGDAATATWLSVTDGAQLAQANFGTDGNGARHLIVKNGGAAKPRSHLDGTEDVSVDPDGDILQMNGRAIFNFMMERVPQSVASCLCKNHKEIDDIDFFIFHQASRFLIETLRERMELPKEKVIIDLAESGNTVSSSIPMALSRLMRRGDQIGKTVLLSGFGVGLSWATNILTFEAKR
jgi:3-oxoacyl-[acyl-carrier-protein] synthase-3